MIYIVVQGKEGEIMLEKLGSFLNPKEARKTSELATVIADVSGSNKWSVLQAMENTPEGGIWKDTKKGSGFEYKQGNYRVEAYRRGNQITLKSPWIRGAAPPEERDLKLFLTQSMTGDRLEIGCGSHYIFGADYDGLFFELQDAEGNMIAVTGIDNDGSTYTSVSKRKGSF